MQKLWKKFKRTGSAHKNDSAVKMSSPQLKSYRISWMMMFDKFMQGTPKGVKLQLHSNVFICMQISSSLFCYCCDSYN
jgi:hypothetical protein